MAFVGQLAKEYLQLQRGNNVAFLQAAMVLTCTLLDQLLA
jgi:hypothetical protein